MKECRNSDEVCELCSLTLPFRLKYRGAYSILGHGQGNPVLARKKLCVCVCVCTNFEIRHLDMYDVSILDTSSRFKYIYVN